MPTARAITERLVKIRNDARKSGALTSHFGISSSQAKSSSGKCGTPRKTATMNKAATASSVTSTGAGPYRSPVSPTPRRNGKRPRVVKEEYGDSDDDIEIVSAKGPRLSADEAHNPQTARSTPLNTAFETPLGTPLKSFRTTTSSGHSLTDLAGNKHSRIDDEIAACKQKINQPDFINGGRAASIALDGATATGPQKRAVAMRVKRYISDGDDGAESDVSDFDASKQFEDLEQSEDLEQFEDASQFVI